MSTIVGIVKKGKVWMGADSFATTEDGDRRNFIAEKMFVNRQYLIGFTGIVRTGQVLKPQYFEPPENVWDFPDRIIQQYEQKGCLAVSDHQMKFHENNIMIATTDGKLYEILSDFQMNEVTDYSSIGSGSAYALGSLYTTQHYTDPRRRVEKALEAAALFNTFTGQPFVIKEFIEDKPEVFMGL